jgi:hypothetical protein
MNNIANPYTLRMAALDGALRLAQINNEKVNRAPRAGELVEHARAIYAFLETGE